MSIYNCTTIITYVLIGSLYMQQLGPISYLANTACGVFIYILLERTRP